MPTALGETVLLPLVGKVPLQSSLAVQLLALSEDHVSVTEPPADTMLVDAASVGAPGGNNANAVPA